MKLSLQISALFFQILVNSEFWSFSESIDCNSIWLTRIWSSSFLILIYRFLLFLSYRKNNIILKNTIDNMITIFLWVLSWDSWMCFCNSKLLLEISLFRASFLEMTCEIESFLEIPSLAETSSPKVYFTHALSILRLLYVLIEYLSGALLYNESALSQKYFAMPVCLLFRLRKPKVINLPKLFPGNSVK